MPPIPPHPAALHPPCRHRDLVRLPGLYRRWDLAQVLAPGWDHHIEAAGETRDGTPLFAVYRDRSSGPDGGGDPDSAPGSDEPADPADPGDAP